MDYLPLFTRINSKTCLLVGGGTVALRKAGALARAGATLRVVAPAISEELKALCGETGGEIAEREYTDTDLDGVMLVIAATDNEQLNQRVSASAQARNILVNVVDQPELCSVILPSIIDRSPLIVAVSSGGRSPVLARLLRAKLESTIPAGYGRLADLLGQFRDKVRARTPDFDRRRDFWEQVLQGPIAELMFAGRREAAVAMLEEEIGTAKPDPRGEVYLVGAGPGDPDLLTFRGLHLLRKADTVLYDRLVAPEILALAREDAELIYVGKARDRHTLPQDNINDLLVHYAREGKKVCRLKGGDPFIFGRGGEELEEVVAAGIPFQVVPGITAASGCAAYAGIPLTHRDHAQSVRFVTGHRKDGSVDLNWAGLVAEQETLVFYMGLVGLREICARLIEHGRAADTPVALVSRGTTDAQEVITGTLDDLADRIEGREIHAPTLIIVGSVVSLHPRYRWFGAADTGGA